MEEGVPSTTACFVGLGHLWGRSRHDRLGSGRGYLLHWVVGASGHVGSRPHLDQKGDKSCSSHANLFKILRADTGHGPPQGFEGNQEARLSVGHWSCWRVAISFDSILSIDLEKLGAENHHQMRDMTAATASMSF